jgi:hypothetical protein
MVGQLELAARVAMGLFVIVAPTLLFLGLWRGLEAMKDEELIERARKQQSVSSSPTSSLTPSIFPDSGAETTTCDNCGTPNVADATYCQQCLSKLSDA